MSIFVLKAEVRDKSFIVVIDPGHGGKDTGALGSVAKEKNINLAVAKLVGGSIAEEYPNVKVIYTRKTDVFIELNERSNIANKAKADLFISIHANASESKTPYGTETYTMGLARTDENLEVAKRENSAILLEDNYKQKYEGFDPNSSESYIIFEFMQNKYMEQSISLASKIQSQLQNYSKRYDRGVRQAGFLVLRTTSMPSVLIELGFISNRQEEKFMNSEAGQQKLAQAICNAFGQYKKDHDRKSGGISHAPSSEPIQETTTSTDNDPVSSTKISTAPKITTSSGVIYKIQILAADKQLPNNSSQLKGYKASFYRERGLYKYTVGETSDWDEISKTWKSVCKDFKDAFIITFKDGVKIATK